MRRTLMLLALLAGFWGGGYDEPVTAVAAAHELSPGTVVTPAGFVRSAPALVLAAPEHGSAPPPHVSAPRRDTEGPAAPFSLHAAARDAMCVARAAEHRLYATSHALARAGLLSSPATAPPSFQII